jgi:hypothetical protein
VIKLELLWYFLAGFFMWNSVPHLVKGITGQSHMTPFKRVSPPELNVIYSFINVIIATFLLGMASGMGTFTLPWDANVTGLNMWAFVIGGFVAALWLANFWKNPNARLPWQKD